MEEVRKRIEGEGGVVDGEGKEEDRRRRCMRTRGRGVRIGRGDIRGRKGGVVKGGG